MQRDRVGTAPQSLVNSEFKGKRAAGVALSWARDFAILAIAARLSFQALELADNPEWQLIDPALFDQGLLIVAFSIVGLYFLGQRRGTPCIAVPIVCGIFGLVQIFLDLFKNTALLPSDVLAWQTAAAVSGGYTYTLPTLAITCIVSAFGAIAALAFIVPIARTAKRSVPLRTAAVAANVACCALCAFGVWQNVTQVDYREDLGVKLDYWDLRNSYHESGFLVSFIAATQDMVVDEPAGYSDESARALQDELARAYDEKLAPTHAKATEQFQETKPSVIAIMNESYSDLSIFDELHDGYEGTYLTHGLKDAAVSGLLDMSVHGGGTCNSEYEFLNFSSMGFLGNGTYPYQQFSFAKSATLPATFKQLGYKTWGMHPNYPGNWNREFVYADMGIDTSLFIYDFDGAEEFHTHVSDKATYDKMLDILRDNDEAQFILDITMQNHGGYDTGSIPEARSTHVKPDFLDENATTMLNEYLSCVQESDNAIRYLLDQLRNIGKPVAVAFFGDHQPSLSRDYNDALYQDEDELDHKARITLTPYFVWTNYDTGTDATHDVQSSANFLGAQLLELIGAPLSAYQKALLVLHQDILGVNTNGFCDSKGVWHDAADGAAEDHPYHQLQLLHYLNVVRNL